VKDIRAQGVDMLRQVRKTLDKNYYDPGFGGVDMDAVFKKAEDSMQGAQTAGQTFGIIAQALASLNDTHTFFIPPSRVAQVNYGVRMSMVGDRCLVAGVKPQSDADKKGVHAGDEIVTLEGFKPTRGNLWKMKLAYYSLQPRPALRLGLRSPEGAERQVEIAASITTGKQVVDLVGSTAQFEYYEILREAMAEAALDPHRTNTFGKEMIAYRMPDFSIEANEIDDVMGRVRKYERIILDLRGNAGGAVSALERVAGHLLGKDVLLAERKGRKAEKAMVSQNAGSTVEGKLVVLVDSDSASAAEILARAIQIEHRGTVIGDRTSGAVRQSKEHSLQLGQQRAILFGVSVTNADLVMKDGKPLEHVGVVPDEVVVNSPAVMAAGGDAVLARAAELLGYKLSAEDAGKVFPKKWKN
jgi:carboxyl-terminal processing protease